MLLLTSSQMSCYQPRLRPPARSLSIRPGPRPAPPPHLLSLRLTLPPHLYNLRHDRSVSPAIPAGPRLLTCHPLSTLLLPSFQPRPLARLL